MKCCSFNCRGLAGPLKRPALKRVIDSEHPDILLLQETLGEGEEIKSRLISLLPGWNFETLDATGRSGGLAIGWNTHSIKISNSWGFESGLGITIYLSGAG
jgi:exonuclease III